MSYGYGSQPTNSPNQNAVLQSAEFGPAVLRAVRDSRLRGYLVGKSVPWDAVDLPLVTSLPQSPQDRAEVNYLIDEANEVVVRMVYRASTGNWVQVGKPPVVSSLPSGVDGMEVNYLIDSVNTIYIRMLYTGGAWVQIGKVPILTTLPAAAYEGYEIIYDTGTAGVRWHLVYDSSDGTTYPWLFIGGAPLYAEVTTEENTSSTSYAALATAGPSVAIPLKGDYLIDTGTRGHADTNAAFCAMSYDIGGTGASDNDWVVANEPAGDNTSPKTQMRRRNKTGLTAVTLTAKYRTSAGTAAFSNRWMSATPIRVGT